MLNQSILVGTFIQLDDNILTLKVIEPEGIITLPITLNEELLKDVITHLKFGATVGIKARLKTEGTQVLIIAEKFTFINTKNKDSSKEEN